MTAASSKAAKALTVQSSFCTLPDPPFELVPNPCDTV